VTTAERHNDQAKEAIFSHFDKAEPVTSFANSTTAKQHNDQAKEAASSHNDQAKSSISLYKWAAPLYDNHHNDQTEWDAFSLDSTTVKRHIDQVKQAAFSHNSAAKLYDNQAGVAASLHNALANHYNYQAESAAFSAKSIPAKHQNDQASYETLAEWGSTLDKEQTKRAASLENDQAIGVASENHLTKGDASLYNDQASSISNANAMHLSKKITQSNSPIMTIPKAFDSLPLHELKALAKAFQVPVAKTKHLAAKLDKLIETIQETGVSDALAANLKGPIPEPSVSKR
jgi:hypothetical protein